MMTLNYMHRNLWNPGTSRIHQRTSGTPEPQETWNLGTPEPLEPWNIWKPGTSGTLELLEAWKSLEPWNFWNTRTSGTMELLEPLEF